MPGNQVLYPPGTAIIAGRNPSGLLQEASIDSTGALVVTGGGGGGGTVNQGNPNVAANGWPVFITDQTNLLGTSTHPLRIDPTGTTIQPISAASLPLPTGAATESTLSALNTKVVADVTADYDTGGGTQNMILRGIALPASGGAVAGGTATNPLRIDPTGTTAQPVNATLSAETTKVIGTVRTIGSSGGVFDAAGQNAASPPNEILVGGQFNTTPTAITSGNVSPLQLDANGNLLVNVKAGGTSGNSAAGPTGSPVPANADYLGVNVGGNLTGVTGLSLASAKPVHVAVVDSSGNQITSFGGTPSDTIGTTSALNALNAAATVTLAGQQGCGFLLAAGTLIGTIVPEISYDGGTTWVSTLFYDPSTQTTASSIVFSSANAAIERSIIVAGGASNARVRVSAFTSGTANCTLRATNVSVALPNFAATQPVSGTVIANQGGAPWTGRIQDGAGSTLATVTASNALKVDGSAVTQPISAASLPLPTGAATSAKQPALGTAGTPSTDVLTVQGISGMTAIKVDGSAVTQPVSGSVSITGSVDVSDRAARLLGVVYGSQGQQIKQTATNFNLQVELATGGTLYDSRQIRALTSSDVVDVSDRSARLLGHVTVDNATLAVTQSTSPWVVSGTVTANQGTANATPWNANIAQFGGSAVSLGAKTSANSIPVVLATDEATLPVSVAGSVSISNFPATQVVSGNKTTNSAAPASDNIGALVAVANASAPSYTEGDQVLLSTDLSGNLRVSGSISAQTTALVNDTVSNYIDGSVVPLSVTSEGRLRVATHASDTYLDFFGDSECNRVDPSDFNQMWAMTNSPWSGM